MLFVIVTHQEKLKIERKLNIKHIIEKLRIRWIDTSSNINDTIFVEYTIEIKRNIWRRCMSKIRLDWCGSKGKQKNRACLLNFKAQTFNAPGNFGKSAVGEKQYNKNKISVKSAVVVFFFRVNKAFIQRFA